MDNKNCMVDKIMLDEYETLMNTVSDAIFLVDVSQDGIFRYRRANKSHEKAIGLPFSKIKGKTPVEALGEKIGLIIEGNYKKCLLKRDCVTYEEVLPLPAGTKIWHTTLSPVFENGSVAQIVGASTDITHIKEIQNYLSYSIKFQKVVSEISKGFINTSELNFDRQLGITLQTIGDFVGVDRSYACFFSEDGEYFEKIYNWSKDGSKGPFMDFEGSPVNNFEWAFKNIKNKMFLLVESVDDLDIDAEVEKKYLLSVGAKTVLLVPFMLKGKVVGFIGLSKLSQKKWEENDITMLDIIAEVIVSALERVKAHRTLMREMERFRVTLHSIGDAVLTTDTTGCVTLLNSVAEKLTGWKMDEVIGKPLTEVFNVTDVKSGNPNGNTVRKVLETGIKVEQTNSTLITKDGSKRVIAENGAPIRDTENNIIGAVLVFRDVTEEEKRKEEIRFLSFNDRLTGIYNRAFFEEEISRLDTEVNYPLSLIIGDVNGLKLTNDVFGHQEGDRLLKSIAGIFTRVCGKKGVVSRWGGDEFAVILPKTTKDEAVLLCEEIKKACFDKAGFPVQTSIALGCSVKEDPSRDINIILKEAEEVMYKHKLLESKSARSSIISSLKKTLFERTYETEEHVKRLETLAGDVARRLNLSNNQIEELNLLCILHDVGKIAIPERILKKEGRLNENEWIEMKKHSEIGFRIAQSSYELSHISEFILCHHERWDGKGYPRGIKENNIPRLSRIFSIVDAFDAMTNDRLYRKAISIKEALEEIKRFAGTQFDPYLADVFAGMF